MRVLVGELGLDVWLDGFREGRRPDLSTACFRVGLVFKERWDDELNLGGCRLVDMISETGGRFRRSLISFKQSITRCIDGFDEVQLHQTFMYTDWYLVEFRNVKCLSSASSI